MVQFESQSIFSISSQPSSLGHVLHDNLEDQESSSFQQDEAEVKNKSHLDETFESSNKLVLEGNVEDDAPTSKYVSLEEHEEWVIEDENDFREEEEYVEEN